MPNNLGSLKLPNEVGLFVGILCEGEGVVTGSGLSEQHLICFSLLLQTRPLIRLENWTLAVFLNFEASLMALKYQGH